MYRTMYARSSFLLHATTAFFLNYFCRHFICTFYTELNRPDFYLCCTFLDVFCTQFILNFDFAFSCPRDCSLFLQVCLRILGTGSGPCCAWNCSFHLHHIKQKSHDLIWAVAKQLLFVLVGSLQDEDLLCCIVSFSLCMCTSCVSSFD